MGLVQTIKNKFGKKRKISTADEIIRLCLKFSDEAVLLYHATDVSKPEDREYFSARATKYIDYFKTVQEEIKLAKEKADEDVEFFVENGDDILAHESQEYYDDLLAEHMADPIAIKMAEKRLQASVTALIQLKEYFDGRIETYDTELVEGIVNGDITPDELRQEAKLCAQREVSEMEVCNPFKLSPKVLTAIGKVSAVITMGQGVSENDALKTATGVALYHINNNLEKRHEEDYERF